MIIKHLIKGWDKPSITLLLNDYYFHGDGNLIVTHDTRTVKAPHVW